VFENILSSHFRIKISLEFSYCTYENDEKKALNPRKNCFLNHRFSPEFVHALLEQ